MWFSQIKLSPRKLVTTRSRKFWMRATPCLTLWATTSTMMQSRAQPSNSSLTITHCFFLSQWRPPMQCFQNISQTTPKNMPVWNLMTGACVLLEMLRIQRALCMKVSANSLSLRTILPRWTRQCSHSKYHQAEVMMLRSMITNLLRGNLSSQRSFAMTTLRIIWIIPRTLIVICMSTRPLGPTIWPTWSWRQITIEMRPLLSHQNMKTRSQPHLPACNTLVNLPRAPQCLHTQTPAEKPMISNSIYSTISLL